MKKQKTVIMLENIKENMLGEKHESLLDENKMLRELLKSALDENKKFCEDLELKQKEVDSYKKMNIEGKEEYGNLRKLYDGAKAERNEYFRMYSELLNENKDLKKSYENFVKAKNAQYYAEICAAMKEASEGELKGVLGYTQYLRKRKTSSQKDVDALNLKLEKARACISDLEAKNEFFYQESIHLKKRLDVYYSLHEGKNDVFDTVTGIVDELEKAFRVTFEFTEPSLKGMAELFRKEKAKMEYQYANIEYVDKMFDKIMKAEKSLKEKEEKFETNKKMVEELYPRFYYLIKNKKLVLEQISNLKRWEEELKDNKIKDAYERLMEQEFEYERRKSRLQENEALLKREERWLHSELVGMNKQRDELINENIEIQRQLYAEIEKNEQVLFIIRSLNSMNPLYEKITKELVASVRGEKTRHIVTSFLKGESIYEIAQREGKSATSVRRMVLLSLMVKTRK